MKSRKNFPMKHIVITGANQGIGYHMVRQLLSDGYDITVLDLQTDALSELTNAHLLPLVCDVSDAQQVKKCVGQSISRFGNVDCAIHNACLCTFDRMEQTENTAYRNVLDVNFFGALNLTRAVVRL